MARGLHKYGRQVKLKKETTKMKKTYLALATMFALGMGSLILPAQTVPCPNPNCTTPGQQQGQRNGKKLGKQDGSGPQHEPGTGGGTGAGNRRGRR
jgi:hypothetical protein